MRVRLLEILTCSASNDDVTLDATAVDGAGIATGILDCPSCSWLGVRVARVPRSTAYASPSDNVVTQLAA
jgi:hypothetical protein